MSATGRPSWKSNQIKSAKRVQQRVGLTACLLVFVLVAVGAAFRGLTFDRRYPIIGSGDEAKISLYAMSLRPEMPMKEAFGANLLEEDMYAYPPLALWVYILVQLITERLVQFPFPTDYVYANRASAALLGVVTSALMGWLGWLVARPLGRQSALIAAVFVGGMWALDAEVIRVNNIGATDAVYYPFFVVSLATTVLAIRSKRPVYILVALLGVIAAVYTKYIPIYGLWLPGLATIVLIRHLGWRRMLPWLLLMAVISVLSAAWLILAYDALNAQAGEAQRALDGGIFLIFSPARNWHNLQALGQYALAWWWTLPIIAAGTAAGIWSHRHSRPTLHLGWLAVFVPFGLFCLMLYSSIELYADWWRARYILPAAMMVMLAVGVSLAQVWVWITTRYPQANLGHAFLFMGLIGLFVLPTEIAANIALVQQMQTIDTRQRVWAYSDDTIVPEGKIMLKNAGPAHDLWHRSWSGYNGATTFEWVYESEPSRLSPAEFVDRDVAYLAATQFTMTSGDYGNPRTLNWIDQLYLLKTIEHIPGDGWSHDLYFYRLLPPQVQASTTFGGLITLDGYDISQTTLLPGDTLELRPFWNAAEKPAINYNIFLHLYAEGNPTEIVLQYDGSPAKPSRPTSTWDDSQEHIPGAEIALNLPADLSPGEYTLALGLYDFVSGARLTTQAEADRFTIPITVRE